MDQEAKRIALYVQRYKLLREIGELQVEPATEETVFLDRCCNLLLQDPEYCLIWVGREEKARGIIPLTTVAQDGLPEQQCRQLVTQLVAEASMNNIAARALAEGEPVVSGLMAADSGN